MAVLNENKYEYIYKPCRRLYVILKRNILKTAQTCYRLAGPLNKYDKKLAGDTYTSISYTEFNIRLMPRPPRLIHTSTRTTDGTHGLGLPWS